jgi:hypothetical protein
MWASEGASEDAALREPRMLNPPPPKPKPLPAGIIRSGRITGPLALRASSSHVREFNSWTYTISGEAGAAELRLSRLRCFNVPGADPAEILYLKCRLLNDGCKHVKDATTARVNSANPRFADEVLRLPLPAGMRPTLQVELWSRGEQDEDRLIAYVQLTLEDTATSRLVERLRLNLKPGITPHARGSISCNFEYAIAAVEGSSPHFFDVHLDPPTAALPARAVWQESVLRELAKANDNDSGVGSLKPLHVEAAAGCSEAVAALLAESVSLESRAKCKWTPLVFAVRAGHPHVVAQLLEAGADVQARDSRGSTPLHRAAYGSAHPDRNVEMIKSLIHCRAAVDARDAAERTPLHVAADNGNLRAAQALIGYGADQWAKDRDGRTPADLAREAGRHGHLETPAVLELFERTKPTPWRQRGGGAVRLIPKYEMDAILAERRVREAMRPPARG